jgi:LAO/AO transport system kinase
MSGAPGLAARVRDGDRRALARAITLVERDDPAGRQVVELALGAGGRSRVVGVTGPPGSGKSTLVDALTARRRAAGRRVGVLAVDPSSPFTAGALLGDRIRLGRHTEDEGVYIRSLATRGAIGGLARAVPEVVALLDAAGFDDVFVETAGVGQSEIEIVRHADTVVLVLTPGAGDETQLIKAGVMEVPDVIAVNRADDPRARRYGATVRGVLATLPGRGRRPAVVLTQATTGAGADDLLAAVDAHRRLLAAGDGLGRRRRESLGGLLLDLAVARLRTELEPLAAELADQVLAGQIGLAGAAERLTRAAGAG